MKFSKQMSESIKLGIILAAAGGFMDAYSYICRGKVFANAQTGNMLLLGVHLSEQDWSGAVTYLFPVVSFAAGILASEYARLRWKESGKLHWRQVAVLIEAVALFGVAFLPFHLNMLANSLTSFGCGIQVECFRKIHGNGIATTMCIGNLRSGTQNLFLYLHERKREFAEKSLLYYGIILCFILGAVIGNVCIKVLGRYAITICAGILIIAFVMMFLDGEKE